MSLATSELLARLSDNHSRNLHVVSHTIEEENHRLRERVHELQRERVWRDNHYLSDQRLMDENLALKRQVQDLEAAIVDLRRSQTSNQELLEKNRSLQQRLVDLETENRSLIREIPLVEPIPSKVDLVSRPMISEAHDPITFRPSIEETVTRWENTLPGDVPPWEDTLRGHLSRTLVVGGQWKWDSFANGWIFFRPEEITEAKLQTQRTADRKCRPVRRWRSVSPPRLYPLSRGVHGPGGVHAVH
eukprot:gnl/MRDRNA2_/MRDRNA2_122445_c0_seq1.p1 gnl/MRDRNA2_/MRDRNA2_122445_c0~~gnl/MRDRNA2_/MRDRNA2_122445_c0_seq1.p1  ORF type:complete len:245 (+),score=33.26 gnl/MRDRNA2_/MRDRNA2_122445_c0_seq1:84-818(+)